MEITASINEKINDQLMDCFLYFKNNGSEILGEKHIRFDCLAEVSYVDIVILLPQLEQKDELSGRL